MPLLLNDNTSYITEKIMTKRVLLIRARKKTDSYPVPHLGLGLLSAVLRSKGHETLVLDYLLFLDKKPPDLQDVVDKFKPDVAGISVYTSTVSESVKLIDTLKRSARFAKKLKADFFTGIWPIQ